MKAASSESLPRTWTETAGTISSSRNKLKEREGPPSFLGLATSLTVVLNKRETLAKRVSDFISGEPVMFQQFNEKRQELETFIILQTQADKREVFWIGDSKNVERKDFNEILVQSTNGACGNSDSVKFNTLSNTKASSTVDINGDCVPDLVLESDDPSITNKKTLEFYYATTTGFCLVSVKYLDDDYLMATFADIGILE